MKKYNAYELLDLASTGNRIDCADRLREILQQKDAQIATPMSIAVAAVQIPEYWSSDLYDAISNYKSTYGEIGGKG